MKRIKNRPALIASIVVLLLAATGAALVLTGIVGGESAEEAAAQEAAAQEAEAAELAADAQLRGQSCEALTANALAVLNEVSGDLNGAGYYESEYADKVSEIGSAVNAVSYFSDPLCEREVGTHLDDAAQAHQWAQDDWSSGPLQKDWDMAEEALRDAEDGLASIYSGEVVPAEGEVDPADAEQAPTTTTTPTTGGEGYTPDSGADA